MASMLRGFGIALLLPALVAGACGGLSSGATCTEGSGCGPAGTCGPCVDGSAACMMDSDCGPAKLCAFDAGGGCQAQGQCFDAPPPGSPRCHGYQPACTCTGQTVSVVCTQYPQGYAGSPILHLGSCGAIDAGGDSTIDDSRVESGPCPEAMSLYYNAPGCPGHPVCLSDLQDACAGSFCGCDGVTFWDGCGIATKPFASFGPCPESGAPDGPAD